MARNPSPEPEPETAVVTTTGRFSDGQLADIHTLQDALQAFADSGVVLESIDDFGTGFIVTQKETLIGAPMVAIEWRFNQGDTGEFVSVTAITDDGRKIVFNDGGTGVRDQLKSVTARREARGSANPTRGLSLPRGLKSSTYTMDGGGQATTFYIA
jgi:hypothetical protein